MQGSRVLLSLFYRKKGDLLGLSGFSMGPQLTGSRVGVTALDFKPLNGFFGVPAASHMGISAWGMQYLFLFLLLTTLMPI